MPETMKILGRTKNKISKNENSKNVTNLGVTEVLVLANFNIANINYQQNSRALYKFVPNKWSIIRSFTQFVFSLKTI